MLCFIEWVPDAGYWGVILLGTLSGRLYRRSLQIFFSRGKGARNIYPSTSIPHWKRVTPELLIPTLLEQPPLPPTTHSCTRVHTQAHTHTCTHTVHAWP